MNPSIKSDLEGPTKWSPHTPPPAGVRLDNLRRRGVDLLRFHLHVPNRNGQILRTSMNLAVVPFIAWSIYANWLIPMLVVLFVLAIVAQQFEASKVDGNWTVSVTPKKLSISRNRGEDESEILKNLDPTDIKNVEIKKSKTSNRYHLKISSTGGTTTIGRGLSEEALVWLKNYLIMEISGRAWRPLYNVNRSISRASKPETATNPTLMGQDLALRLIEIYQNEAPQFVQQLGEAVKNKDPVAIRQNAHWLKSASAHIGAKHMSESCQVMQIYGMDNNLERTEVLFEEINRTNDELIRWLSDVSDVSAAALTNSPPDSGQRRNTQVSTTTHEDQVSTDHDLRSTSGKLKILVVDDSSVSQEIARNFLDELTSDLAFAEDGQAALDICANDQFDLILTDCEMFGMDGYEFAKKFRAIENRRDAKRTPIVALTAHALKGDRARCLEAGMDDYLSKPYTIDELHNKIKQWVSQEEASYYAAPTKVPAIA